MLNARSTEPIRRPASLMPPASCSASRQSWTRTYVTSEADNAAGTASSGSLPTSATRGSGKARRGLDEPQRGLQEVRGDENDVGHRLRTVPVRQPGVTRRPQYHAAAGGRRRGNPEVVPRVVVEWS